MIRKAREQSPRPRLRAALDFPPHAEQGAAAGFVRVFRCSLCRPDQQEWRDTGPYLEHVRAAHPELLTPDGHLRGARQEAGHVDGDDWFAWWARWFRRGPEGARLATSRETEFALEWRQQPRRGGPR